ncbi:hypothetical protein EDD85DRAFT_953081 [Armillaria nabsnona]|nr:hypothetical protein EDD85DRAFT_953081 [Armillaria nabsnona]
MVYQLTIHVDTAANNPATTDDVNLAALYQHRIFTMYTASEFIPSLTFCGVMKHATEHRNDERPAWATDLAREVADIKTSVTRMDTISAKFDTLNAMVTSLDESVPTITKALKAIRTDLHRLMVLSARMNNLHCQDGQNRPFKLIPLPNRQYAHECLDPMRLPALWNITTLTTLTDNQLNSYLDRYGIAPEDRNTSWIAKLTILRTHIGCSDYMLAR